MPERDHNFYDEKHEEDHCPGCGMKFSYAVDTCICEEDDEDRQEWINNGSPTLQEWYEGFSSIFEVKTNA